MDEGPEREASAKLAQHLAIAVQVAEAVIRLRAHRTENRAGDTQQATGAARAERTAQHAADRVVFSRALDSKWTQEANLIDLGRAWGAATGWADTDPSADIAAERVEARMREQAPNAMARYDEQRADGTSRVDAMRDVLADVATESQTRVFVADPASSSTAADAQSRADAAADLARRSEGIPDDLSTPQVDEHAEGVGAALPRRDEQATWQDTADTTATAASATDGQVRYITDLLDRTTNPPGEGRPTDPGEIAELSRDDASAYITELGGNPRPRRLPETGNPHPADTAADHHPRPYTAVKPAAGTKTDPASTAARTTKTRTLSR